MLWKKIEFAVAVKNLDEFKRLVEKVKEDIKELQDFEFDISVEKESAAANDAVKIDGIVCRMVNGLLIDTFDGAPVHIQK